MLSNKDTRNIDKAAQGAAMLVSDMQALHSADNPLLTELAHGLLEDAVALKFKLDRLAVIAGAEQQQ